ncbi:MAG: hypothetical protein IKU86_11235 [Thermoguttaceae bacterium]|nr:hypothetical protein [Thermoguttaceae bacterium]
MTVKELIEELEKWNPNARVYVRHYGGYDSDRDELYNARSEITEFIGKNDDEADFRTDSAIMGID